MVRSAERASRTMRPDRGHILRDAASRLLMMRGQSAKPLHSIRIVNNPDFAENRRNSGCGDDHFSDILSSIVYRCSQMHLEQAFAVEDCDDECFRNSNELPRRL